MDQVTLQNVIKRLKVSELANRSCLLSAEFSLRHICRVPQKDQDLQLMTPAENHLR